MSTKRRRDRGAAVAREQCSNEAVNWLAGKVRVLEGRLATVEAKLARDDDPVVLEGVELQGAPTAVRVRSPPKASTVWIHMGSEASELSDEDDGQRRHRRALRLPRVDWEPDRRGR